MEGVGGRRTISIAKDNEFRSMQDINYISPVSGDIEDADENFETVVQEKGSQTDASWQDVMLNYSTGVMMAVGLGCGMLLMVLAVVCCICCHYKRLKRNEEDKLLQATAKLEKADKEVMITSWHIKDTMKPSTRRLEPEEYTDTEGTETTSQASTITDDKRWMQSPSLTDNRTVHSEASPLIGHGPTFPREQYEIQCWGHSPEEDFHWRTGKDRQDRGMSSEKLPPSRVRSSSHSQPHPTSLDLLHPRYWQLTGIPIHEARESMVVHPSQSDNEIFPDFNQRCKSHSVEISPASLPNTFHEPRASLQPASQKPSTRNVGDLKPSNSGTFHPDYIPDRRDRGMSSEKLPPSRVRSSSHSQPHPTSLDLLHPRYWQRTGIPIHEARESMVVHPSQSDNEIFPDFNQRCKSHSVEISPASLPNTFHEPRASLQPASQKPSTRNVGDLKPSNSGTFHPDYIPDEVSSAGTKASQSAYRTCCISKEEEPGPNTFAQQTQETEFGPQHIDMDAALCPRLSEPDNAVQKTTSQAQPQNVIYQHLEPATPCAGQDAENMQSVPSALQDTGQNDDPPAWFTSYDTGDLSQRMPAAQTEDQNSLPPCSQPSGNVLNYQHLPPPQENQSLTSSFSRAAQAPQEQSGFPSTSKSAQTVENRRPPPKISVVLNGSAGSDAPGQHSGDRFLTSSTSRIHDERDTRDMRQSSQSNTYNQSYSPPVSLSSPNIKNNHSVTSVPDGQYVKDTQQSQKDLCKAVCATQNAPRYSVPRDSTTPGSHHTSRNTSDSGVSKSIVQDCRLHDAQGQRFPLKVSHSEKYFTQPITPPLAISKSDPGRNFNVHDESEVQHMPFVSTLPGQRKDQRSPQEESEDQCPRPQTSFESSTSRKARLLPQSSLHNTEQKDQHGAFSVSHCVSETGDMRTAPCDCIPEHDFRSKKQAALEANSTQAEQAGVYKPQTDMNSYDPQQTASTIPHAAPNTVTVRTLPCTCKVKHEFQLTCQAHQKMSDEFTEPPVSNEPQSLTHTYDPYSSNRSDPSRTFSHTAKTTGVKSQKDLQQLAVSRASQEDSKDVAYTYSHAADIRTGSCPCMVNMNDFQLTSQAQQDPGNGHNESLASSKSQPLTKSCGSHCTCRSHSSNRFNHAAEPSSMTQFHGSRTAESQDMQGPPASFALQPDNKKLESRHAASKLSNAAPITADVCETPCTCAHQFIEGQQTDTRSFMDSHNPASSGPGSLNRPFQSAETQTRDSREAESQNDLLDPVLSCSSHSTTTSVQVHLLPHVHCSHICQCQPSFSCTRDCHPHRLAYVDPQTLGTSDDPRKSTESNMKDKSPSSHSHEIPQHFSSTQNSFRTCQNANVDCGPTFRNVYDEPSQVSEIFVVSTHLDSDSIENTNTSSQKKVTPRHRHSDELNTVHIVSDANTETTFGNDTIGVETTQTFTPYSVTSSMGSFPSSKHLARGQSSNAVGLKNSRIDAQGQHSSLRMDTCKSGQSNQHLPLRATSSQNRDQQQTTSTPIIHSERSGSQKDKLSFGRTSRMHSGSDFKTRDMFEVNSGGENLHLNEPQTEHLVKTASLVGPKRSLNGESSHVQTERHVSYLEVAPNSFGANAKTSGQGNWSYRSTHGESSNKRVSSNLETTENSNGREKAQSLHQSSSEMKQLLSSHTQLKDPLKPSEDQLFNRNRKVSEHEKARLCHKETANGVVHSDAYPHKHPCLGKSTVTQSEFSKLEMESGKPVNHCLPGWNSPTTSQSQAQGNSGVRPSPQGPYIRRNESRVFKARQKFGQRGQVYSKLPFPRYPYNLYALSSKIGEQKETKFTPKKAKRGNLSGNTEWDYRHPPERKVSGLRRTFSEESHQHRTLPLPVYPYYPCFPPSSPPKKMEKRDHRVKTFLHDSQWDLRHLQDGKVSGLWREFSRRERSCETPPVPSYPYYIYSPPSSPVTRSPARPKPNVPDLDGSHNGPLEGNVEVLRRTFSNESKNYERLPLPQYPYYPCSRSPSPSPRMSTTGRSQSHLGEGETVCRCKKMRQQSPQRAEDARSFFIPSTLLSEEKQGQSVSCSTAESVEWDYRDPPERKVTELRPCFSYLANQMEKLPSPEYPHYPWPSKISSGKKCSKSEVDSARSNDDETKPTSYRVNQLRRVYSDQSKGFEKIPFPEWPHYPCSPPCSPPRKMAQHQETKPLAEGGAIYRTRLKGKVAELRRVYSHHCNKTTVPPRFRRQSSYRYKRRRVMKPDTETFVSNKNQTLTGNRNIPQTYRGQTMSWWQSSSNAFDGADCRDNQQQHAGRCHCTTSHHAQNFTLDASTKQQSSSFKQSDSSRTDRETSQNPPHHYPYCVPLRVSPRVRPKGNYILHVHRYPFCPPQLSAKPGSTNTERNRQSVGLQSAEQSFQNNTVYDQSHYVNQSTNLSQQQQQVLPGKMENPVYTKRWNRCRYQYRKLPFPQYPYYLGPTSYSPPKTKRVLNINRSAKSQTQGHTESYELRAPDSKRKFPKQLGNCKIAPVPSDRQRCSRHGSALLSDSALEARRQVPDTTQVNTRECRCKKSKRNQRVVASVCYQFTKTGVRLSGRSVPAREESHH